MKRYSLFFLILLFASIVYSQGLTDALKYGDNDIMGTARYMSLAGSMGAIGGDPSALIDNPGGLAVYRGSEVSFSLNASPSVNYAMSSHYNRTAKDFYFNFNHASYIFAINSGNDEGYVSSNFGFSYNRLKDFHRTVMVSDDNRLSMTNMMADITNGFGPNSINAENQYMPFISVLGYEGYLIDPNDADTTHYSPYASRNALMAYKGVESGRVDEYNFSYAVNVGHYLYVGASVGLQTLNYSLRSASGEEFSNGATMVLNNDFSTSGYGCVLRVGAIARPISFLRLGLSFQSPVWYTMSDLYSASIETKGTSKSGVDISYLTPYAKSYYDYNSPLKFQASMGFVIGKTAFINVDYQFTDYKNMRLIGQESDDIFLTEEFQFENREINSFAKISHTIKAGAEVRIASKFSFRAGFAYRTPNSQNVTRTIMDNTTRTDMEFFTDHGMIYASGGFGYRYNGFGFDIAYGYSQQNQQFHHFQENAKLLEGGYYGVEDPATQATKGVASIKNIRHNVVFTMLYKF